MTQKENADLIEELNRLKTSEKHLLETNKKLSSFAQLVAHDLKAPLRGLGYYHYLIQKHLGEKADSELGEYFDDLDNIVDGMRKLIDDLLFYSELSGDVCLDDEIDINKLVDSLKKDLQGDINDKQAVITTSGNLTITGNKTLVRQLFSNLIGNALKYYEAENIEAKIEIMMNNSDEFWHFSIRDNGIGIDPKYHEYIFEPFKRLHHQDKYEGRGLGLDMCKKIVTIHDGDIWVDSVPNKGSNFQFTLRKNKGE